MKKIDMKLLHWVWHFVKIILELKKVYMTDNDDLFHNSKHNLRQFKEAKFYQISSINSKFNELKFFFALLLGLKNAKVEKKIEMKKILC